MELKTFTNTRVLRAFLAQNLGTVDIAVDTDYWGDEEDAVLDMMDSVIIAARQYAVRSQAPAQ